MTNVLRNLQLPSRRAYAGEIGLERFDPLDRVLIYDDFSRGLNGWTGLIGNYEDSLDCMKPVFKSMLQPMISTAVSWDTGSHGAMTGDYSMKIASRPQIGAMNLALKRITYRTLGVVQVEAYLTAKPEASELTLSIEDIRSIGFFMDLQTREVRGLPHLRFLNCLDGKLQQTWQFKQKTPQDYIVSKTNRTRSLGHLTEDGWENVPGGTQQLCYNELPTKLNWQYFKFAVDLATMEIVSFQFNDVEFDTSTIGIMKMQPWANLDCMLNVGFFVETDTNKRAFLFIDSILVSGAV